MLIRETGASFGHFVTNVCAIVGGTFTVCSSFESQRVGLLLPVHFAVLQATSRTRSLWIFCTLLAHGCRCTTQVMGMVDAILHALIQDGGLLAGRFAFCLVLRSHHVAVVRQPR